MLGYGFSQRLVEPQGTGANGVLILGEAPGQQEDFCGYPFFEGAPAGAVLERAIRRVGMDRQSFVLTNTVPYRPPSNWLEGAPWRHEACSVTEPILAATIDKFKPRAILALGGIATVATTGLAGDKLGVSYLTGFVMPSRYNIPVVPCFHPAYLRRGKMSHLGVLMRCIKLAVAVAKGDVKVVEPDADNPPPGYVLRPDEQLALEFEKEALQARYVAYDIETPWSNEEDIAEEAEGEQRIESIQFALRPRSGIYLPWRDPFIEIAKRVLRNDRPKLNWNGWKFDNPVLRTNGCTISGENHDLMWAWHHLQPDLPRGLQFAAAQMAVIEYPWKHTNKQSPEFYGIIDADVLVRMIHA